MACPAVGAFILVARSEDENSCEGDRRLRRKQGAVAGEAVAEDKSRPKGRQPMRAPQMEIQGLQLFPHYDIVKVVL